MKFLTPTTTWLHFLNLSFYPAACRWLIFSFRLTAPDTFLALYYFFFLPARECFSDFLISFAWKIRSIRSGEDEPGKSCWWSLKSQTQSTWKINFKGFVITIHVEANFYAISQVQAVNNKWQQLVNTSDIARRMRDYHSIIPSCFHLQVMFVATKLQRLPVAQ